MSLITWGESQFGERVLVPFFPASNIRGPLAQLPPGIQERRPQPRDLPARRRQVRLQLRLPLPQPLNLGACPCVSTPALTVLPRFPGIQGELTGLNRK